MNTTYIYLFTDMDGLGAGFASDNIGRLPEFRRKQCEQYLMEADRNCCILTYLLLEKGLREHYGAYSPAAFVYNDYGKPYLKDMPNVFFNFSHCRRGVVCALSDFETGVDIQDMRPYDENTARRVCTCSEMRQLAQSDDPARMFCRLWAKKESYAKANGIGIADVLNRELPDTGFFIWERETFCIALFQRTGEAYIDARVIPCALHALRRKNCRD